MYWNSFTVWHIIWTKEPQISLNTKEQISKKKPRQRENRNKTAITAEQQASQIEDTGDQNAVLLK